VAYSVPNFGSFLSLVGSSICTILGFILPCYFHLAVLRKELPYWQVGLDCLLMIGGVLFGMLGTYQSFVNLLNGSESIH
jgi:proton-coupled amino acid transporter